MTEILITVSNILTHTSEAILAAACVACGIGAFLLATQLNQVDMRYKVQKALFLAPNGNPLGLKDGEKLPKVTCVEYKPGFFKLTISAGVCTTEQIEKISTSISSALNKRYRRYAVAKHETDLAFNSVAFFIEDVLIDRRITANSVDDFCSGKPELLRVDQNTNIDLTLTGSMIFAGKTRSGKTTAIISLLLQIARYGRDNYDSQIIIIDPKKAELSRIPHTYTLDENGEARQIIEVMKKLVKIVRERQSVLNDLSEQKGDVVHWWEADMHPSIIFMDEYVSLRSILPTKAAKDDDYCLATFDSLLKQIVTMGASSGSFVILSVAECSVGEAGVPTMIKSAMSTKVLMRPMTSLFNIIPPCLLDRKKQPRRTAFLCEMGLELAWGIAHRHNDNGLFRLVHTKDSGVIFDK